MNCTEFEAAVELAVERHEPLEPETLLHVDTCEACRKVWERNQRLDAAIVAWRFAEPPTGLAESVLMELTNPPVDGGYDDDVVDESPGVRQVDAMDFGTLTRSASDGFDLGNVRPSPAHRAHVGRSGGFVIALMTVCLLMAVIFTMQSSEKNAIDLARISQGQRTSSEDRMELGNPDASLDLSGTLRAVLSDLRSEYHEIATETTSVAREMVNAIPHPIPLSVLPDADEIHLRPNSSDVARIWSPIGSQVGSALGFLWQAVPSDVPSG